MIHIGPARQRAVGKTRLAWPTGSHISAFHAAVLGSRYWRALGVAAGLGVLILHLFRKSRIERFGFKLSSLYPTKTLKPESPTHSTQAGHERGPGTAELGSAAASKSADTTALKWLGLEGTTFTGVHHASQEAVQGFGVKLSPKP